MKKIVLSLMIAALMLSAFAGCGAKTAPAPESETGPAGSTAALQETEPAATEKTTASLTEVVTATATAEPTSAAATAPSAAEASTASSAAPATTAEIVALYNQAVNKVKPEASAITRTYHHVSIPTESLELPSAIQGLGETAIKQFVKGTDEAESWTSKEDIQTIFPVGDTEYSSRLTPEMVKSATCVDNGKTYTIRLVLQNDRLTNPKKGEGYAGVFNTVAASTFNEISIPTVTFEKVSINGINGSIICTVDKETRRVNEITFANTDILDLNVKVAFSHLHAKMDLVSEDHFIIKY